ncbi:MAG: tetratricopeptide repeat protein [Symploca sp. SIO2E6]|nr:tetratricopeptide repeat protein [Symploca sp. SIO2E6]
MTTNLAFWDEDLPPETPEEQYQTLVRSLRRRQGFGLLFVRCSPADGELLVEQVKQDLPQKDIETLQLDQPIQNLYDIVAELPHPEKINILFIEGLEYSLYQYEAEKLQQGWETGETYAYSMKGVPLILGHLNLHRERFRDDFNICFVFLLRSFALKYFIHRAPDFFDWRSAEFKIPLDQKRWEQESFKILEEGDYEQYLSLAPQEQAKKLLEIEELLTAEHPAPSDRASLWLEQGILLHAARKYEGSIASYDQAVKFKPDFHQAWYNRGVSLYNLGRYEAAIVSYDQAVNIKPDFHEAWYNRGISLRKLGRDEAAIASYDQAVNIKPDKHEAWNNRGNSLRKLGRYEAAIASYDQAVNIKPDLYPAWYNQGISLDQLGRYEAAIASYDQAVKFKPDYHEVWYDRGISLYNLGRYEAAIVSYDQAVNIKPDYHKAWYNKACCYALQNQVELALENLQQAIKLNPEEYLEMAKTDSDFDKIWSDERFQTLLRDEAAIH